MTQKLLKRFLPCDHTVQVMPRDLSSKRRPTGAEKRPGAADASPALAGGNVDRPAKKTKLMLDDDASDSDSSKSLESGVKLAPNGSEAAFTINSEYARRFEHNKRREEVQQRA